MQGSHARAGRLARLVWAGGLVAALASTAAAQDYTLSSVSGQFQTLPTSGTTTITISEDMWGTVNLPFSFPYFGKEYTKAFVCDNGFIILGTGSQPGSYGYWYNTGFPTTNAGNNCDGMIGPLWNDYSSYSPYSQGVYTWTTGSAPNRVTYIHWEKCSPFFSTTPDMTFQAQLHETSGRIIFAYPSTSSSAGQGWESGASIGIDEPAGTRYVSPNASATSISNPGTDYRFDPDITRITGSVEIANVVSDASGFGNSSASPKPANGLRLELRSGSTTNASGYLDSTGEFEVQGVALNSSQTGQIVLSSETLGCRVSPSTVTQQAAAYSTPVQSNISYGDDSEIGAFVLDDINDDGGIARAPMQIASEIEAIRSWIKAVSGKDIPKIEVFYDENSGSPSGYTPAGQATPAYIRIAGSSAANPDAFDGAVVARVYMRHVIASLTGQSPPSFTQSLDVTTDAAAAFADALGVYVHAYLTGEKVAYDGLSNSSTIAVDLETPSNSLTRPRGPAVAGWAAAALYDLIDAANEGHDVVDGTSGTNVNRVIAVLGNMTSAPTPATFVDGWVNRGYPGGELVTDFIHHGLLPDDANEPNDTPQQAKSLGTAGLRRTGLTLNRYNTDWFTFSVAQDAPIFYVEMVFNRFATAAVVDMRVYRDDLSLVSVASPDGDNGPIRALIANLTAGTYYVQIQHISGQVISPYELQIYAQMSLGLTSAPAWTVGRRIQEPVALFGGIPPYTILARDGGGDLFSAIQFIPSQTTAPYDMVWTPKEVGDVIIQIIATDSGSPTHSRTLNLNFAVNAELAFSAPDLTGVALNKQADVNLGRVGGTDPVTLSDQFGDFPGALTLGEDFHIRGIADEPGGGAFGFRATDVAGSEAEVDSFLVVCVPIETKKQAVTLAAGQAAAGFYFDALSGSDCKVSLKTAKKNAKRELNFLLIGPDGNVVQGGKTKVKAGTVKVSGLSLPATGRYFMAFESDDGGPETELQGTLTLKLPSKGSAAFERMELNNLYKVEFGALEGATFSAKGKTTEGMEIRVVFIVQPDGNPVPFEDIEVTNNNGKVSIQTKALAQDGTYALYLMPLKTDLADASFKFKIRQPSGGSFSVDD